MLMTFCLMIRGRNLIKAGFFPSTSHPSFFFQGFSAAVPMEAANTCGGHCSLVCKLTGRGLTWVERGRQILVLKNVTGTSNW